MNEALIGMLVKSLGLKAEVIQGLIGSVEKIPGHFEDMKILLQDSNELLKKVILLLERKK